MSRILRSTTKAAYLSPLVLNKSANTGKCSHNYSTTYPISNRWFSTMGGELPPFMFHRWPNTYPCQRDPIFPASYSVLRLPHRSPRLGSGQDVACLMVPTYAGKGPVGGIPLHCLTTAYPLPHRSAAATQASPISLSMNMWEWPLPFA